MRRATFVSVIAVIVIMGSPARSQASSLYLYLSGDGSVFQDWPIEAKNIDFSTPLLRVAPLNLGVDMTPPPPTYTSGTSSTVTTPLNLVLTLGYGDANTDEQPLASVHFVGTGTYLTGRSSIELDMDAPYKIGGYASGTLTTTDYTVMPGIDPTTVPSWLQELQATVSGQIVGGYAQQQAQSWLDLSLPAPASPQPVPEPAAWICFCVLITSVVRRMRVRPKSTCA